MISTRHIRHDWNRWFDLDSPATTLTMCGVRSRVGLTGIPTVTSQPLVVMSFDRAKWGWCVRCCYNAYVEILSLDITATSPEIASVYRRFTGIIERPAKSYAKSQGLDFAEKVFENRPRRPQKSKLPMGVCYLCQESQAVVADHIIPVSRGGSDDSSNLGPACRACNIRKSNASLEDVLVMFPKVVFPPTFLNPLTVT